jgi:hypothetical protein
MLFKLFFVHYTFIFAPILRPIALLTFTLPSHAGDAQRAGELLSNDHFPINIKRLLDDDFLVEFFCGACPHAYPNKLSKSLCDPTQNQ